MTKTIYWHDYEAWGADPRQDRASQFAGIRTNLELEEVGEPLMMYCQPSPDRLPHPKACLITGISPQKAKAQGLPEAEFVRRIHQQFAEPGTCVAGYNNIRFDDELSRQLFYRNFYDPYEREWKNGNSRWDIIDMLRLCQAVRPDGIQWVRQDDGSPVFKLELLTQANGLLHDAAHDALSDVRATIAMARKVKQAQPRLYDYVFELRNKQRVQALIDWDKQKPFWHVSAMYSSSCSCIAPVMPLAAHPHENNGVLLYDLTVDPSPWLTMDVERLSYYLFTARKDLEEGEQRLPVMLMHSNRCPVIAPFSIVNDAPALAAIDQQQLRRHWQLLRENPDFVRSVVMAFAQRPKLQNTSADPDLQLYSGGFFADADKRLMVALRKMSATELATQSSRLEATMQDPRLPEMLFRYRARNFPHSLTAAEQQRWKQLCGQRWLPRTGQAAAQITHSALDLLSCREQINLERADPANAGKTTVLDELEQWLNELEQWVCQAD
jgi:exodeoxyribonuclease I